MSEIYFTRYRFEAVIAKFRSALFMEQLAAAPFLMDTAYIDAYLYRVAYPDPVNSRTHEVANSQRSYSDIDRGD